jgi:hypothetical protein
VKKAMILAACLLTALFVEAQTKAKTVRTLSRAEVIDHLQFHYSSSDGDFQLDCKHMPNLQLETDYDVYCGKGTPNLKQYLVHLIIRSWSTPDDTTYEILYWVTDRGQGDKPVFSSTSQLLTLDAKANIKKLSLSQSLENDAAQLYLDYAP